MKKKNIIIILSAIVLLCCTISSCSEFTNVPPSSGTSTESTDASAKRIEELEAQIVMLMQNQHLSEQARKEEIAALKAELEKLKQDTPVSGNVSGTGDATDATDVQRSSFTYTLENGKAVITKINTTDTSITVPSTIDGYNIYAIGTEAICSPTLKSVVISSGIEKIDWFAFKNCIALSSVTIPDTVSTIGYGAFDNAARSFTINCLRDSFAHKYAQSYGFAYNIT